eukprot:5793098-Prymnesium_polylepis.3
MVARWTGNGFRCSLHRCGGSLGARKACRLSRLWLKSANRTLYAVILPLIRLVPARRTLGGLICSAVLHKPPTRTRVARLNASSADVAIKSAARAHAGCIARAALGAVMSACASACALAVPEPLRGTKSPSYATLGHRRPLRTCVALRTDLAPER